MGWIPALMSRRRWEQCGHLSIILIKIMSVSFPLETSSGNFNKFSSHFLVKYVCAATLHICLLLSAFLWCSGFKNHLWFLFACFVTPSPPIEQGCFKTRKNSPCFRGFSWVFSVSPEGRGQGLVLQATAVSLLSAAPNHVPRGQLKVCPGDFHSRWQNSTAGLLIPTPPQTRTALRYDLTTLPQP